MKTLKFLSVGFLFLFITNSQAQVSVNVNIGTPPIWAPVERVETQYYYLPEIDTYYDVPAERFIYVRNGNWIRSERLPARYSNYNLRGGKVVYLTDYRGNSPYVYHNQHRTKYVTTVYRQPNRVVYVKEKGHGKKYKNKDKHHDHGHHDD